MLLAGSTRYLVNLYDRLNRMGMDPYKINFATVDDEDYYERHEELELFWGIAFTHSTKIADVKRKWKEISKIAHPDKHPDATEPVKQHLKILQQRLNFAFNEYKRRIE